ELVSLGPSRLMVVLITDTGRVEQRVVECPGSCDESVVADLRARLNALVAGVALAEAAARLEALPDELTEPGDHAVATAVVSTLLETLVESREERVVMAGAANLARFGQD